MTAKFHNYDYIILYIILLPIAFDDQNGKVTGNVQTTNLSFAKTVIATYKTKVSGVKKMLSF